MKEEMWINTSRRTINFKYYNPLVAAKVDIKLTYNKGSFQFTLPQGDIELNMVVLHHVKLGNLIQSKYNPWTFILLDSDAQSIIDYMRDEGIEEERLYHNQWTKDE